MRADKWRTQDQRGGSAPLQSSITFDPATGRLDTVCAGENCKLQDTKVTFDKAGNLTQRTRARQTAPTTETFQYDPLNRLTQAALTQVMGIIPGSPQITASLSYDALGNICSKNGQQYSYAGRAGCPNYGFAASPHAVTATAGISYQYDASGNQTTTSTGRSLSYNGLHQLTSANAPNAQTTFQYAASGEAILRIDGNQPVWPAGCGNTPLNDRVFCNGFDSGGGTTGSLTTTTIGNVEFLKSSNGTTETRRYLGVAIDYIRPNNANETRYVFADHLGSPEAAEQLAPTSSLWNETQRQRCRTGLAWDSTQPQRESLSSLHRETLHCRTEDRLPWNLSLPLNTSVGDKTDALLPHHPESQLPWQTTKTLVSSTISPFLWLVPLSRQGALPWQVGVFLSRRWQTSFGRGRWEDRAWGIPWGDGRAPPWGESPWLPATPIEPPGLRREHRVGFSLSGVLPGAGLAATASSRLWLASVPLRRYPDPQGLLCESYD